MKKLSVLHALLDGKKDLAASLQWGLGDEPGSELKSPQTVYDFKDGRFVRNGKHFSNRYKDMLEEMLAQNKRTFNFLLKKNTCYAVRGRKA